MDIDREETLHNPEIGQKAEGKIFPGFPQSDIKTDFLKTFLFDSPEQLITIETKEFSALCEYSGLPDSATLKIEYYPTGGKAVELKALKYYIVSFRQILIFQEKAAKRIYNDMKNILETEKIRVTLIYNIRGGFDVTSVEGSL